MHNWVCKLYFAACGKINKDATTKMMEKEKTFAATIRNVIFQFLIIILTGVYTAERFVIQ